MWQSLQLPCHKIDKVSSYLSSGPVMCKPDSTDCQHAVVMMFISPPLVCNDTRTYLSVGRVQQILEELAKMNQVAETNQIAEANQIAKANQIWEKAGQIAKTDQFAETNQIQAQDAGELL